MDVGTLRELERIFIACGAVVFGVLGYRLFIFGKTEGEARLTVDSKLLKAVFSGTAPGLFFMLCGAAILAMLVLKGGVTTAEGTRIERTKLEDPEEVAAPLIHELGKERGWLIYHDKTSSVQGGGGGFPPSDPTQRELYLVKDDLVQMHKEKYERLLTALQMLPGYVIPMEYRSLPAPAPSPPH